VNGPASPTDNQRCMAAAVAAWSEQASAALDDAFSYSHYHVEYFTRCERFFDQFRHIKENRERALEELSRATNHALASV